MSPPQRSSVFARARKRATDQYTRLQWLIGPLLLVGGILWDYATLRIDRLADNLLLALYLVLLAGCITVQLRESLGTGLPRWLETRVHWTRYLAHFLLGGLLSAYFIYFFTGAPLLRAAAWLVVLAGAALAVEFLPAWSRLPALLAPILAAVTFHFGLAGLPVLLGDFVGPVLPLMMSIGLCALVHIAATLPYRRKKIRKQFNRTLLGSSLGVAGVLFIELLAFEADLIPPLPLTLMQVTIAPEEHGEYAADPATDALAGIGFPPKVMWTPGLRVEARTPVFLPARMETTVLHVWEHWDTDDWVRTDAISLDVRGGRREGFRTYSRKRSLIPGLWRVRVTTVDGRELGRVRFDLQEG